MDIMAWIFYFIMIANQWAAEGFRYDLQTATFVNPQTGERRIVMMQQAPGRSVNASTATPRR